MATPVALTNTNSYIAGEIMKRSKLNYLLRGSEPHCTSALSPDSATTVQ